MTTTLSTTVSDRALSRILSSYASASRGDKVRIRNAVTAGAMAGVMAGDMSRATRYGTVAQALDSARSASVTTGPDYVGIASDLAATLEAAASALRAGVMVDGVDHLIRATRPGVADDAMVEKLSTVRTRAARSANGTVAAWIAAHVTDVPMTIAQLRASADVTAYMPSTGAIGACLVRVANGDEEVDGFAVADVDGRRGAVAI
jgi:hypothetical protein